MTETEYITVCPMEGNEDSSVFHEDIPWNYDPCEVEYNSVMLEKFFHPRKAKPNYLMSSYAMTAKTQGKKILGREGWRKTILDSI